MTVRINLLPRSYHPPRQVGFRGAVVAAIVATGITAVAVGYVNFYNNTQVLERRVQAGEVKLQGVKAQLAQAVELKTREERVTKAEADLRGLQGRHWSSVLLALRDLTPQQITWTSLNVQGDTITLKAISRGMVDVAQLFGGLIVHNQVEQVALHFVNEKGVAVTIVGKAGDRDAQSKVEQAQLTYRQLELEFVITLIKEDGGKSAHGT